MKRNVGKIEGLDREPRSGRSGKTLTEVEKTNDNNLRRNVMKAKRTYLSAMILGAMLASSVSISYAGDFGSSVVSPDIRAKVETAAKGETNAAPVARFSPASPDIRAKVDESKSENTLRAASAYVPSSVASPRL